MSLARVFSEKVTGFDPLLSASLEQATLKYLKSKLKSLWMKVSTWLKRWHHDIMNGLEQHRLIKKQGSRTLMMLWQVLSGSPTRLVPLMVMIWSRYSSISGAQTSPPAQHASCWRWWRSGGSNPTPTPRSPPPASPPSASLCKPGGSRVSTFAYLDWIWVVLQHSTFKICPRGAIGSATIKKTTTQGETHPCITTHNTSIYEYME